MNIIKFDEKQTVSSLDLLVMINGQRIKAGEPALENNKFIAKVENELDDISTDDKKSTVVNRNNQSYYTLTFEQCLLVGMRESKSVRRFVLAKIKELETELALRIVEEASRIKARQAAALQAPEMTDALKDIRQEAGKETASHHYSNEYDMINRIVLGEKAKDYRNTHNIPPCDALRDHLSFEQIRLIELAQRLNEDLIIDGDSFDSRKNRIKSRIERERKSPRKARKALK
jgi:hypothetical protein